ncbi:MAG: DEAD/DEAH box helicase family protein [Patescibacteria group bacterium]|nr:DEAD/DEAH box helicase family protein [Patescibacteria group bacterium]
MSFGESSHRMFKPKSPEQLKTQVEDSEFFWEQSLIPAEHSEDTKEIMQMSVEELKEKYPVRYKMYLKSFRESKNFEGIPESNMTDEEKTEMKELKTLKMRLRMMNNLDKYVHDGSNGEGEINLREHQVSVFEDLRNFLESGGTSGYIELPTGTGKTVIFIEFLRVLDVPVVIVVPTKDLVRQTKTRLDQFAPNLDVGSFFGETKEYDTKISITTYNSLPNLLNNNKFDKENLGLVILDEAHETLSKKRSEVVEKLKKEFLVVGFTATSEYSETKTVGKLLGTEIHQMSLREAIESGALAPCSAMVAKTSFDISKVKIKDTGDYDEEELDKVINVEARNKAVAEIATTSFAGKQKIVFCGTRNHAHNVAELIRASGETVEVVVGDTQDKIDQKYRDLGYKDGWKEAYDKKVINTVVSADLLTRGTDLPSAEICLNAKPTKSLVKAKQRGGRVTRLDPNNPNKHAVVVDFVDAGGKEEYASDDKLFFQILGGTEILPIGSDDYGQSAGGTRKGTGVPDIKGVEGIEVVVDLEEMERLVAIKKEETIEEKQERYREIIKAQIGVDDFCAMDYRKRLKFKIINGSSIIGLVALSSIFSIEGNPINRDDIHIALAKFIYGEEVVNKVLEKYSPDTYRDVVRSQIDVAEFCNMSLEKRRNFKISNGNSEIGLMALSSIFGIEGDPTNKNDILISLAKAIYGEEAMNKVLEKNSPETYREIVKGQMGVEEFCVMGKEEKEKYKVSNGNRGISLRVLSNIFGIHDNPLKKNSAFIALTKAIYGEEEVNKVLEKDSSEAYRKIVMEQMDVERFCSMPREDRLNFKVNSGIKTKGLFALSSMFGIKGDPTSKYQVHVALARVIYGEAEVNKFLEGDSPKTYREIVKKQINFDDFCNMNIGERQKFKITNGSIVKGLFALSRVFGIEGNPIKKKNVHISLARAIYGEEAVNEALAKKK